MDIPKTVITITSLKSQNGRYAITDEKGNNYSFFEKKQDGNSTKAMETFGKLNVKEGDTVVIAFKTSGKYKNILWFEEADPKQIQSVPPFPNKKELEDKKKAEDEKWEKIGIQKTRCVIACAMIEKGYKPDAEAIDEMDKWVDIIRRP